MKHVVTNHCLQMLHESLKSNKARWDQLNSKIDAKAKTSNEKHLADLKAQRAQTQVVITLLSCCFIEALANYYLSSKCGKGQFKLLARSSLLDKWTVVPSLLLKEYVLPKEENEDLELLINFRNRLTHSKPRVTIDAEVVHNGYLPAGIWLSPVKCVSLPVRLIKHLCFHDTDALDLCISSRVDPKVQEEIIAKIQERALKKLSVQGPVTSS